MNQEQPWNWTRDDFESLLGQTESLRLDFKQSSLLEESHNEIVRNLSREVSAFANSEGGIIVIGVVERREGKARVADHFDDGVDWKAWPPERLQQTIEANVSPHLVGIRVKAIHLNAEQSGHAYIIYVPQGTTAYQAHDKYYYGRSEYESKPLPDHEIRLLMFRGKVPRATVRVKEAQRSPMQVLKSNAENELGPSYAKLFKPELDKLPADGVLDVDSLNLKVAVENVSEINISV